MKFRFRLETVMKSKKIEMDLAQRDYMAAEHALATQLALISRLYGEIDSARAEIAGAQEDRVQTPKIQMLEDFIEGQKVRITREREKARELMQVKEEKHEILVEKTKAYKVLEKLKDRKREAFRKEKNLKLNKESDDLTIMRYQREADHE